MKILFTGASSFTGYWFVKTLISKGHEVVCPLRGTIAGYQGVRKKRVALLYSMANLVEDAPFGSESFLKVAVSENFDVLCHHAANVTNYRSGDFDIYSALRDNSFNLRNVLNVIRIPVMLTGSVFEQDEGCGEPPLRAFSPYGLSKGLTYQAFRYFCFEAGVRLGKFVIPNPFGPFEEARFTSYLMKSWRENRIAEVNTGKYLRDNIPVDLLALTYELSVMNIISEIEAYPKTFRPSGYIGSQDTFVKKIADEVRSRTDLECLFSSKNQNTFSEPIMRVNNNPASQMCIEWNESLFWDEFVDYYKELP